VAPQPPVASVPPERRALELLLLLEPLEPLLLRVAPQPLPAGLVQPLAARAQRVPPVKSNVRPERLRPVAKVAQRSVRLDSSDKSGIRVGFNSTPSAVD
jgi:hypothetical protein